MHRRHPDKSGDPPAVPLQNAHLLNQAHIATFEIRFNLDNGQSQMNISGNFPMHSLIALLSLTHLKLLGQMGATKMEAVEENGKPAGEAGNAQANPAESMADHKPT